MRPAIRDLTQDQVYHSLRNQLGAQMGSHLRVRLADTVSLERVQEDYLILVGGAPRAVHVSGQSAKVVAQLLDGKWKDLEQTPELDLLLENGVAEEPMEPRLLSRRSLVSAGAVGATGLGSVLLFPSVASATSRRRVAGIWLRASSLLEFRILVGPNGLPAPSGFPYNYSPLTVEGVDFAVYPTGDATRVTWALGSGTLPSLSGTVEGTFSVEGLDYLGVFTPPAG
jgi:hypothetical protein